MGIYVVRFCGKIFWISTTLNITSLAFGEKFSKFYPNKAKNQLKLL